MNKKVWVEVSRRALTGNVREFRSIIGKRVKLWAVIKSNAYGHGLVPFARLAARRGVDGFCVDSVVEGVKLREAGIKNMVLVLGPTLDPSDGARAYAHALTLTIVNFGGLRALARMRRKPTFHLKVDTGMHRQGFYVNDLPRAFRFAKEYTLPLMGIYTHFASANGAAHRAFTDRQFEAFKEALALATRAGFTSLIRHAAATGAALMDPKYHLDAVRIGKGLYGLWPSARLRSARSDVRLSPVLSWRTRVSEVKTVPSGGYIGYDLTERAKRAMRIALVPIGYWHGYPRNLSSVGVMLIRGARVRVVGRVSMDLIALDVTRVRVRPGDTVTLIGSDGRQSITAERFGSEVYITNSEAVTRINPLIERIVVY